MGGKVRVLVGNGGAKKAGYAPTLYMNLSSARLRGLGWQPQTGLIEALEKMIEGMKISRK